MNLPAVTLTEISKVYSFHDVGLRERLARAPESEVSHYYRGSVGDEDVAFVVIDIFSDRHELVLYELVVSVNRLRQGIGTATLRAVQEYAASLGRTQVVLIPRSLDASTTDDQLRAWYRKRGYSPVGAQSELFYKSV